ncbi:type II toxin-antitoxin system RelE/ParE family toxin [Desulfuromonas sp. CSMB_57]|jgi:plasmid stabilization system protein ParE|uniref:type II toxin-antitoxin system RelE/ParE family toxin n=1 Tax=Desulfuromonas sp. CSMB_57 TaxID=2807629 RepID=UPI001CD732C9|nr:type II toxin-antitoxin system RelE/ParE family toxin [Desulfuromonas sp. CSMB_57]
MKIVFLLPAQAELDDAFSWYEEQAVGLGYELLDEIDQALRLVVSFPELQPQMVHKVRRCLVNRFPYGIYYGLSEDTIVVVAVAHLKRKPTYWIDRMMK